MTAAPERSEEFRWQGRQEWIVYGLAGVAFIGLGLAFKSTFMNGYVGTAFFAVVVAVAWRAIVWRRGRTADDGMAGDGGVA